MILRRRYLVSVAAIAAALFAAAGAGAGSPAGSAVAEAGKDDFGRYCASCHGADASGGGPVSAALSKPAPDLTRIAERRGGSFPVEELAALIDGRALPAAHGKRDMPVWGEQFADGAGDGDLDERVVRGRVRMLLVYLESIQR